MKKITITIILFFGILFGGNIFADNSLNSNLVVNKKNLSGQLIILKIKCRNTKYQKYVEKFEKLIPKLSDEKLKKIDSKIDIIMKKISKKSKYINIMKYLEAKVKIEILKRDSDNKDVLDYDLDYSNFCEKIRLDGLSCNLHNSKVTHRHGIIIKNFGNGEKINLGDFVEIKVKKGNFIVYVGDIDDIISGGLEIKELDRLFIGGSLKMNGTDLFIKKKSTKTEYLDFFQYQDRKKLEIELNKKQKKDHMVISIIGIKQETGLVFEEIRLGGNFKYGDEICFKGEDDKIQCQKLEEGGIIAKLINDYGLGVGTKFRQYYNGGNGGQLIEIVTK